MHDISPLLKTRRLQRLAALVPPCHTVIDVGTDHALLPIALVLSGIAQRAIASDLLPRPLEGARHHIATHQLEDRVEVRLGDGLATLRPDEAQVVTIAGMGIKSILHILDAHPPDALGAQTLVLQTPQFENSLRQDLHARGWSVRHEELLLEADQLYHILQIDLCSTPHDLPAPSPLDALVSPYLRQHQDHATLRHFVEVLRFRLAARERGQLAAHLPDARALSLTRDKIALLRDYLEHLGE